MILYLKRVKQISHKIFFRFVFYRFWIDGSCDSSCQVLWTLCKSIERFFAFLIYFHNRCKISHSIDVIWSWPNSWKPVFEKQLKPFMTKLMGSSQVLEFIEMKEFSQNSISKDIPSSSRRHCKSSLVFLRITPHQIAQRTIMWNFNKSIQSIDLIDRFYQRR